MTYLKDIKEIKSKGKKMSFINFKVNIQNFVTSTDSAYLIELPKNSGFKEFRFWVSKKLVRRGDHGYQRSVGFPESFQIKAQRVSKKDFRKVLGERIFSPSELAEAFAGRA